MAPARTKILVFGSNLAGRHGRGAAWDAMTKYGAVYGVGWGRTGNAYAIPTKGYRFEILSLSIVKLYIDQFVDYAKCDYAKEFPEFLFELTEIGCGLARGTKTKDQRRAEIAPLFKGIPPNVEPPPEWKKYL